MGERLLCKQEVIGSIPFTSTSFAWGRFARYRSDPGSVFVMVKRFLVYGGCRHDLCWRSPKREICVMPVGMLRIS